MKSPLIHLLTRIFVSSVLLAILLGGTACTQAVSPVTKDAAMPGAAVRLLTPAQQSESPMLFPNLTWNADARAFKDTANPVGYEIQIATDPEFSAVVDSDTVYLNRYVPDRPLPKAELFWRVRASNGNGVAGEWSQTGRFKVTPCDVQVIVPYDPTSDNHQPAVQEALEKAIALNKQGKSVELSFSKGTYIVRKPANVLLNINGAKDLVITGNGSFIRLTDFDISFARVVKSDRVVIQGFEVDMPDKMTFLQGHVTKVNQGQGEIEVSMEKGFPSFDDEYVRKSDGSIRLLDRTIAGRLKTGVDNYYRIDRNRITKLGDRSYRLALELPSYHVEQGRVNADDSAVQKQIKFFEAGDRFVYALSAGSTALAYSENCEYLTFYDITDYSSNMHYVSLYCSALNVLHCRMVLKEGRWFQGTADGVHCRAHKIGPWVEGVEINGIGDDGVALYARPMTIQTIQPGGIKNRLLLKKDHFAMDIGDNVTFFRPQTGEIMLETTVQAVKQEGENWLVDFKDAVPPSLHLAEGLVQPDQIWNRSKSCGDFMIRNNSFKGIRRYGNVFRAEKGVIENNLFQGVSSAAVMFLNETQYPNGLYASNVIIQNNTITDCTFDTISVGVVSMLFKRIGGALPAESFGPHGILIEGNTITDCHRRALELWSVRDVVLRNNRVDGQVLEATDSKQITLRHTEDIKWLNSK